MNEIRHIGIFDSGIGGLSVANFLYKEFPNYAITYLADNAYFPFGEKDEQVIYDRLLKGIEILEAEGCQDIIIACNTASIVFDENDIPSNANIITVTQSLVDAIRRFPTSGEYHVLATKYTVKSYFYQNAIARANPKAQIYSHALPDWVDYVENKMGVLPLPELEIAFGPNAKFNILIACTHFSFVLDHWIMQMPKGVQAIDSSRELAMSFKRKFTHNSYVSRNTYKLIFTDSKRPHIELTPDIPWECVSLPFDQIV